MFYFPLDTIFSTFCRASTAVPSAQSAANLACVLACLQLSLTKPLICAWVSLIAGTFFSYSQINSDVFCIVTGIRNQPAVIPTARGVAALRRIPRFLETIEPARVATRTYIAPGRSCSPVSGAGAREAMVLLKSVSFRKAHVRKLLVAFSTARDWSKTKSRARLTCSVNRSVGVGDVGLGVETGEVDDGFGVVGATG